MLQNKIFFFLFKFNNNSKSGNCCVCVCVCVCVYVVKEETLGWNRKIFDSLLFCSICPHCWCCCCLVAFSRSVVSDSFVTPWTVARQAPLSMGFPRQEYWSGLPFPAPGHLPHPGMEPESPVSCALAAGFFITESPGKPYLWVAIDWLLGKDPDAGKDWRQEEKGTTEDEMVGWHHWLDGHEFEQALGVGDGQGSLACCNPWGHKELDMTDRLNWTERLFWEFNWMST